MPVIINSAFKPKTYDELSKPLIQATEAQQELEDAYGTIAEKASAMEAMANAETDPITHAKLKAYSEDLKYQADQLATNGLQRASRQALLNMKSRYSSDVTPAEVAYKRRQELADEQRKLQAQNPDMLFQRRMDRVSLDQMVDNPMLDYGNSYSGAMITKRVAEATEAATRSFAYMQANGRLDEYHKKYLKTNGIDPAIVEATIRGGKDANGLLMSIRDNVLASTGVNDWGDDITRARALQYANEGLRYATGKSEVGMYEDKAALVDLAWRYKQKELGFDASNLLPTAPIKKRNIYSQKEQTERSQHVNQYAQYFDKQLDGTYKLNEAGKKAYNEKITSSTYVGGYPPTFVQTTSDSSFKTFMDGLNDGKAITNPNDFGNLFGSYASEPGANYDATKLTEYIYDLDSSAYTNWTNIVKNAAGSGVLQEADWDNKTNSWDTGKNVKVEDVFAKEAKVTAINYSPYGITMTVTGANGSKRYKMPSGINSIQEKNLMNSLKGIERVQQLNRSLGTNTVMPMPNDIRQAMLTAGIPLMEIPAVITKQNIEAIEQILESDAMGYMSQYGNVNTNKPTEFNAYRY